MADFIAQKDEVCEICGEELPKGSFMHITDDGGIICEACENQVKDDDEEEYDD